MLATYAKEQLNWTGTKKKRAAKHDKTSGGAGGAGHGDNDAEDEALAEGAENMDDA